MRYCRKGELGMGIGRVIWYRLHRDIHPQVRKSIFVEIYMTMEFDFYKLPLRERWDVVLWLYVTNSNTQPYASIGEIVNCINGMAKGRYTDNGYQSHLWQNLKPIVEKLYSDNYISDEGEITLQEGHPNKIYAVTEKGREFYLIDGGYSKDFQNKMQVRSHAEQVEKVVMANNKWMKIGTVLAAIATSVLVLIEFLSPVKMMPSYSVPWLTLCLGIFLGITTTLFLQELRILKLK